MGQNESQPLIGPIFLYAGSLPCPPGAESAGHSVADAVRVLSAHRRGAAKQFVFDFAGVQRLLKG